VIRKHLDEIAHRHFHKLDELQNAGQARLFRSWSKQNECRNSRNHRIKKLPWIQKVMQWTS